MGSVPVMATKTEPVLISIRAASKLLDLSRPTIQRRIEDGTFEAVRIGKTIRLKLDSINAILEGPKV